MTRSAIYHDARRELIQRHPQAWAKIRADIKALYPPNTNYEAEVRKAFIRKYYPEYQKIVDQLRGPKKTRVPKSTYEELLNHPRPATVLHSRARAGTQAYFLSTYPNEVAFYREQFERSESGTTSAARSEMVYQKIRDRHPGEWSLKYDELLQKERNGLETARALHKSSGKVVQHNES